MTLTNKYHIYSVPNNVKLYINMINITKHYFLYTFNGHSDASMNKIIKPY